MEIKFSLSHPPALLHSVSQSRFLWNNCNVWFCLQISIFRARSAAPEVLHKGHIYHSPPSGLAGLVSGQIIIPTLTILLHLDIFYESVPRFVSFVSLQRPNPKPNPQPHPDPKPYPNPKLYPNLYPNTKPFPNSAKIQSITQSLCRFDNYKLKTPILVRSRKRIPQVLALGNIKMTDACMRSRSLLRREFW